MSDQNEPSTWRSDTERFEAASPWLGDAYAPQLRSLYAYADALDRADAAGEPNLALVEEYARLHRWFINKQGGGRGHEDEPAHVPDLLDMLNANPGVRWQP